MSLIVDNSDIAFVILPTIGNNHLNFILKVKSDNSPDYFFPNCSTASKIPFIYPMATIFPVIFIIQHGVPPKNSPAFPRTWQVHGLTGVDRQSHTDDKSGIYPHITAAFIPFPTELINSKFIDAK
jgi:hypothetical protein